MSYIVEGRDFGNVGDCFGRPTCIDFAGGNSIAKVLGA